MGNYLSILKVNLKHNLGYHILCCIVLLSLAPIFMSTKNLEQIQTIIVIEKYASLIGIILMITVFMPDTNIEIRELTLTKKISNFTIIVIRGLQALIFIVILSIAFLIYLKINYCLFDFKIILLVFFANSIFLGSLGMLIFSIFNQPVMAYMFPIFYFITNIFSDSKVFSYWYLFSQEFIIYENKMVILISALIIIVISIFFRLKKNGSSF